MAKPADDPYEPLLADRLDHLRRLPPSPPRKLRVVVVGAGVAGLAVALGLRRLSSSMSPSLSIEVVVLERARELTEAGAGVQLAPNATRVLRRLGVLDDVAASADACPRISVRRYSNNEEIGSAPLMPSAERRYGAPSISVHRADLQRVLLAAVEAAGCDVLTGREVVAVEEEERKNDDHGGWSSPPPPRVLVRDVHGDAAVTGGDLGRATWLEADIVLGADGIRSAVRSHVLGALPSAVEAESRPQPPLAAMPTGDVAYRMLIPRERMSRGSEALRLLDSGIAARVLGPGGHIMAYTVRKGNLLNVVLLRTCEGGPLLSDSSSASLSSSISRSLLPSWLSCLGSRRRRTWADALRAWWRRGRSAVETAAESDETISCKNSVSSISNSSNNRNSATPDKAWTTFCGQGELLRAYRGWSPLVQSLIHHAPPDSDGGVLRWDLRSLPPLERWTSRRRSKSQAPGHGRRGGTGAGSVALLGDAAHPMLPYVAQGAANAIEDAGALVAAVACALGSDAAAAAAAAATDDERDSGDCGGGGDGGDVARAKSQADTLSLALAVYELARKGRAERIQASAAATGRALHLPDGPEQERRDLAIRRAGGGDGDDGADCSCSCQAIEKEEEEAESRAGGRGGGCEWEKCPRAGASPDLWIDRDWQDYMMGVDVMRDVVEQWDALADEVSR